MMNRASYFLFLALLAVHSFKTCSIINNATHDNISDFDALIALKDSIVDPHNILPVNWSTSFSVCDWIGITCNPLYKRVESIDLPHMGLAGTIPPKIGNLSFLIKLNVNNNSLGGKIPMEIFHLRRLKYLHLGENHFDGEFPGWLGALAQLEYLSLNNNQLSGPLSSDLANATKIEEIDLSFNFFTGNVPEKFSALNSLRALDLSNNQLNGPWPPAFWNRSSMEILRLANNILFGYLPTRICDGLPQLKGIDIGWNEFHGEIPSGIGECSVVQILALRNNKISGNIPRGIWNLTTLRILQLSGNNLRGEIAEDISSLYNLTNLYISDTNMTGVIPHGIGNLSNLEDIELTSNNFTGEVPLNLFNSSRVKRISLVNNNLFGTIPSNLWITLPNIKVLYLGGNEFINGNILASISNASMLQNLSLESNQFSGQIPTSLGNLRSLEVFSISSNNFWNGPTFGELSFLVSLTQCTSLNKLDISGNPLNGYLPSSLGNFSASLVYFDASGCGIEGEVPSSIGNLIGLQSFRVFSNRLKGKIPTTIKELLNLQRLNMGSNDLEGPIPVEFCHLLKLGILNLQQNKFSGPVPSCIGDNMTSLRYLYLGSNNLNSSLPESLWNLENLLELNLSANSIIGNLSPKIGNMKAITSMSLEMNQFSGEIPRIIGKLQNLQWLSLAHNKLEGQIPDSLNGTLMLWHLDLSFNNLTGAIPKSLEALTDLQYFNVSYNKLSGPIPRGGSFAKFTNQSFIYNEALCDAPWLQPCKNFQSRSRTKRILLFALLAFGLATLASVIISILLMRKWRRRVATQVDLFVEPNRERVSIFELQRITNGFSEANLLGSGTFGSVYKGTRENGIIWAVKVFHLQLEGALESFHRECEALILLRHRNLTKVVTACSNLDFKALVLEYMPNGSLEKWLHSDDHFLNVMQRLDIMIDVACGLDYLHHGCTIPVVHCDLKPSNILLDQHMITHVSDFGIAKLLGDGESTVQTQTLATCGYIAPEYGSEGLVSTSCDVYSFGITLMETFTKKRPNDEMFTEKLSIRRWVQESITDSVIQIIDTKLLQLEDEELTVEKTACVSSILQLALNCTTNAPQERINIRDALVALQKIKLQVLQANKQGIMSVGVTHD